MNNTNPAGMSLNQNGLSRGPLLKMLSNFLLFAAMLFFTSSLFLTVFFTSGDHIRGIWVLLTGWLGFLVFQFGWFANPLILLVLLHTERRPLLALLLSVLALIVATDVFLFDEIPAVSGTAKIYMRELGMGGYLWYGAIILLMCSSLCNLVWRLRTQD